VRSATRRVDAWCRYGDFTVEDVAVFRVLFAVGVLLTLQPLRWIADVPASRFDPPAGPMRIFSAAPPEAGLLALEVGTAVLAAMLLLGLHTRTVSLLLALTLGTGLGLVYSLGKIDHTIVFVLVPAVMAFSGWGGALSMDARRSVGNGVRQWPLRLLALLIAVSFLAAGITKLRTGWLDPDTHAVQGHFVRGFVAGDRSDQWLAPHLLDLRAGALWEAADWFTVAMEIGLVLTVLWWRAFRVAIAVVALFHVGVLLLLNIVFSWNVLGYGAFVRWASIVPVPGRSVGWGRPIGYVLALVIGCLAWLLHHQVGPGLQHDARVGIVFLGGVVAVAFLVSRLRPQKRR
jgi:hypothetical protein